MAGNSQRRGAMRNPGSKKGAVVGSGGQRRKGLEGKGPTPKATQRTGHAAGRKAAASRKAAAGRGAGGGGRSGGSGDRSGGGRVAGGGRTAGARSGHDQSARNHPGGSGTELIAGRNAVVEALRAGVPVKTLYVAERIDVDDRVREALQIVRDRRLPLLEGPRGELDRLTAGAVHQGLVLQVPPYTYAHPDDLPARAVAADEPALIVALDGVTDPRNLGAVVRSAAAFGAHGVIVPERRAAGMTAAAWKSSAGAAVRLPVAQATNLARTLRAYKEQGIFVVGLTADGDTDLRDLEIATEPVLVVIGSEGKGLSRVVEQACDVRVRIPMASEVESLNASVAAAIVLHEVASRRDR